MNITIKKLPKSEIEVSIVVDTKEFETYHDKGFKAVQEMIELDGFRKGNAPENLIVQKYGEMIILEEMANLALRDAYIKAVDEHKLSPISDPKITINKLAKGNPLEITMIVPVMPEVTLPKYKKVAEEAGKGHEIEEVTDKDIEDVVLELAKGRAHQHAHSHEHEHDENGHHPSHDEPASDAKLPEINDEFAQSFGEDFKTLADLKTKIKENLGLEKKQKAKEKKRTAIVEALIAETKADVPDALIEMELERMLAQMKADITRFGGTWEEYLKHTGKTEADVKSTWKDDALKRTMSQLILAEIALAEKIVPTPEEIEVELVRLLATVQDADEDRAKAYLHQALTNEKVLAFLEEGK
jgi:FKBP-type peptidyl-prolyl cis-trans isomerase (trigger factor)